VQIQLLVRTVSFRLVALYAVLFCASVVLLAAVVYFKATSALDVQIRTRIAVDTEGLTGEYMAGGLPRLKSAILARRREHLVGGLEYGLYTSAGVRILGPIPMMAKRAGWQTLWGPPDGDEPAGQREKLAVYSVPLARSALWLFVADDIGRVNVLGTIIITTFGWALLLFVTLAVAGGTFLSARFLRRIESVRATAERIIDGDFKQRIPRRGVPDDLDRLAATLNHMLDRTGQLVDTVKQISNDVAHDLRTPLGRLRQRLEDTLRNAETTSEYKAGIDAALADVDSIMGTFGAILRLSQIESGTRRSGFRPVDLTALVIDACDTFRTVAEELDKGLDIKCSDRSIINGDPELLAQLLANLVENAITHTPVQTNITAELANDGRAAVLTVSDDGPGVPKAEHDNLFKRFYRVNAARSKPGNGLGLSIVAAIADLHGAHYWISDRSEGFSISVEFPLAGLHAA
jgi:signal transduction histidine kinase